MSSRLSRAKHGLYLVGNKRHIDRLDQSKGRFLINFQSEYIPFCRRRTSPAECQWYQAGQVDVSQEADPEEDSTDSEDEDEGDTQATGWGQQSSHPPRSCRRRSS